MRSSTLLSALFVAGTLGSPILQKRDYVTEYDVVTVVAYVTEGAVNAAAATTTAAGAQFYQAPAPTTIEAPPPPPPVSSEASAPSSTPAAAPAPAPAPAPASAPAAAPANVQQAPAGNDFKSQVLYHHNVHRANHSADPLQWDENLASYAQEVAARCLEKHDTSLGGGGYGQNLGGNVAPEYIGGTISQRWYNDEAMLYKGLYGQDSPDMSNFLAWGHFSQVVWKSTTTVGCYTQACPNGIPPNWMTSKHLTVCNYGPPGNMGGAYNNVGAPLGHPFVNAPLG